MASMAQRKRCSGLRGSLEDIRRRMVKPGGLGGPRRFGDLDAACAMI